MNTDTEAFRSRTGRMALTLALGLGFAPGCFAKTPMNPVLVEADRQLAVSLLSMRQTYIESGSGKVYDREEGRIPGLAVSLGFLWTGGAYVHGAVRDRFGSDTYVGATHSGVPVTTETGNRIATAAVRGGYGFMATPDIAVIPYLTGGNRAWRRALGGPAPYSEVYDSFWLGAGVLTEVAVSPHLVVSGFGSAGRMVLPFMTTSIDGETVAFQLGARTRVRAGISLDYRLRARLHLLVEATYVRFAFGTSGPTPITGTVLTVSEPASTTEETSLQAGVAF